MIKSESAVEVVDLNGRTHRPLNPLPPKGVSALIFIMHDCPIANGYAPEINAIVREYSSEFTAFYIVHADPSVRLEQAKRHAEEFGFRCPVLMDADHLLTKAVGATISPEAVVIGSDGAILYRGRIDDRVVDYGKKRIAPSQRDLREALDAALAGRPALNPRTKAIGCIIPRDGRS